MSGIRIVKCDLEFVREPLTMPFGFKGRYLDELWQTVVKIDSEHFTATAPCVESVLWSDASVFGAYPPALSSSLMRAVMGRALKMIEGQTFVSPDLLIDGLLPELQKYADTVCGFSVAPTFVLNALVGLDLALWILYAKENGISSFDGIVPDYAKAALSCRHETLAHIPLISYAVDEPQIKRILDSGTAILKIKIGKAVPGVSSHEEDMKAMVEWDIARLKQIHELAKRYETPLSKDGNVLYYLDANGRYGDKSLVEKLLYASDEMGALPRVALLEEPLAPDDESFVGDLPVCVNADETAHSLADVKKRLALGYGAVALKPIAKTLSVSFRMAAAIHEAGGQALCADLTVNPFLAEWNKRFASRIRPLSPMKVGCVEVNGDQNYLHWNELHDLLPAGMERQDEENGGFALGKDRYGNNDPIFETNGYLQYFKQN